jgi:outer membrane cobalamin receptor
VRSERSDYFDAGVTHSFTPEFSATLDGYYKRASNQLDEGQFGAALIFSPFNYRVGHVYGVEVSTNFTRGGFSAYANIALSRATGKEITSGEFQFDPDELAYIAKNNVHLDHDQTYTISSGASYRFADTMVFADFLYGTGLRRGFANTDHLPEYHPINLGIEHTFKLEPKREVRARIEVVNVFDESYALRDGSGIGVGAPQYGQRRGVYGTLGIAF